MSIPPVQRTKITYGSTEPYLKSVKNTMDQLRNTNFPAFNFMYNMAQGNRRAIPPEMRRPLKNVFFLDFISGKIFPAVQRALQSLYPCRPTPKALPHLDGEFTMPLLDRFISSSNYLEIGGKLLILKNESNLFKQLENAIESEEALVGEEFKNLGFTDGEGNVLPGVKGVYRCLFTKLPQSS